MSAPEVDRKPSHRAQAPGGGRRWRLLLALLWLLPLVPVSAAVPAPVAHGHGLLWKIEAPGVTPSYLFGTMHSADPRMTTLAPVVWDAFNQASSFTMEMLTNGSGLQDMARAMSLPKGQTLEGLLGPALYRQTRDVLGQYGLPTRELNQYKPWYVVMQLSAPPQEAGLALDLELQLKATLAGKPTYGLETMQEQIAVFNDMPLPDQIAMLRESLQTPQQTQAQYQALIKAYAARDLAALVAMSRSHPAGDAQADQAIMDRLVLRRNRIMAERMLPRLKEGSAFIAVGALHLPGRNGILSLLEQHGYQVTPVY